jgi:hypothetical protein
MGRPVPGPKDRPLYMRARWYDPNTGELLSVDPDFDQTLDAYGYSDENPMDGTGSSGLMMLVGGWRLWRCYLWDCEQRARQAPGPIGYSAVGEGHTGSIECCRDGGRQRAMSGDKLWPRRSRQEERSARLKHYHRVPSLHVRKRDHLRLRVGSARGAGDIATHSLRRTVSPSATLNPSI